MKTEFSHQELAEYCVNKFPCDVEVAINPNMYMGGKSEGTSYIQGLGTFNKETVNELARVIEEASNQVYADDSYHITDPSWLDVFPADKEEFKKYFGEPEPIDLSDWDYLFQQYCFLWSAMLYCMYPSYWGLCLFS